MISPLCTLLLLVAQDPNALGATDGAEAWLERIETLAPTSAERLDACRRGIEQLTAETPADVAIRLYMALGDELIERQLFDESRQVHEAVATRARATGDTTRVMLGVYYVAYACVNTGDFERALAAADEAATLAGQLQRHDVALQAHNLAGVIHQRQGHRESAIEAYGHALETVERLDNAAAAQAILNNLSVLHMNAGQLDKALEYVERARVLAEQLGSPLSLAAAVANIGDVHFLAGRFEKALDAHLEALAMREEHGSEGDVALSLRALGEVWLELEQPARAIEHLERARVIQTRIGLEPEVLATLSRLSRAYAALDKPEEALRAAEEGERLAEAKEIKALRVRILRDLAAAQEIGGDFAAALQTERRANELDREVNSLETLAAFHRRAADTERKVLAIEKNAEIARLERDAALAEMALVRERFLRNSLIVVGALLFVLSLVGWSWLLVKRREALAQRRAHELKVRLLEAERLESLGLLAGGVAHDMNNLMTSVLGNLQLLDRGGSAPAASHLRDIETACHRGRELVDQMLVYSGDSKLECAPVDLRQLIEETVALVSTSFPSICFEVQAAPGLPLATGDRAQLGQVLMNLLTNGAEACSHRTGSVTTRLSASTGERTLQLEVADDGDGMTEAVQSKIFEPFFSQKPHGRGLGLATVQSIVHHHGGSLSLRSAPGQGTTFSIELPTHEHEPADQEPVEQGLVERGPASPADFARQDPTRSGRSTSAACRVLVVDDEGSVRQTTGRILEMLGYKTELAQDGEDALDRLSKRKDIGVVILDIAMPRLDGADTLLRLRSTHPQLPVLLVSGYDRRKALRDFADDPAVTFLRKPYGVADLRAALTHLLPGGLQSDKQTAAG